MHNTSYQQKEIILEILRTRSIGGGSVRPPGTPDGGGRKGDSMPIPGDRFYETFGVLRDRDDPCSGYVLTQEGKSRLEVERALLEINEIDPMAYAAINEVFNQDTGGYRDWEHYQKKGGDIVYHVGRGIWLLIAKLPPSRYPLEVRFAKEHTPEDKRIHGAHYNHVYRRYKTLENAGLSPGAITAMVSDEYGTTERRIEQIVAQEREREGLPKRKPGRPRKAS